jgi:hypothetical protein
MAPERITYQNWIADLGRDPSQPLHFEERSRPVPAEAGGFEPLNDQEVERRRPLFRS